MATYMKKFTYMTGLAVAKAPRKDLIDLYKSTLLAISEMPTSMYTQQVETITKHRLDLTEKVEDVMELEKKINCGQIEEVIIQAQAELSLVEKMKEWRAWEPLEYQQ